jgi:hypothetical protein
LFINFNCATVSVTNVFTVTAPEPPVPILLPSKIKISPALGVVLTEPPPPSVVFQLAAVPQGVGPTPPTQ